MDLASQSNEFAALMWSSTASSKEYLSAAESGSYPTVREVLVYVPLASAIIWVLKVVSQLMVFGPLCKVMLRLKPKTLFFQSEKLEAIYLKHKPGVPDINEIKSLSKTIDRPLEDLNRWFRERQMIDRDAVKIRTGAESMWRLVMYGFCLMVNVSVARTQPWWKNVSLCWDSLPFQAHDEKVKLFFVGLEIPLYMVLLLSQLTDSRRAKDMWEMTAHHGLVLILVTLLFLGNFVRIGMIGLAMHDVTDLFLESSKLSNMLHYKGIADLLFAIFGFSWAYFRLYKFSTVVLWSFFTDGLPLMGPIGKVFGALISVLLGLNLFWFQKIMSMMYRLFWAGTQKERRQRDQTDLSTDDEGDSDSSYLSDAEIYRHED